MGRIIAASALGGWLAIVAIWYDLTHHRLVVTCGAQGQSCVDSYSWQLTSIIVIGLSVALVFIIATMIAFAVTKARHGDRPLASKSGWVPANRGQQTRLR